MTSTPSRRACIEAGSDPDAKLTWMLTGNALKVALLVGETIFTRLAGGVGGAGGSGGGVTVPDEQPCTKKHNVITQQGSQAFIDASRHRGARVIFMVDEQRF
jgi:hypothetical protein